MSRRVIVMLFFCAVGIGAAIFSFNEQQSKARQNAEAFYATLQVGTVFDPDAFARQVMAKGGEIRNFASPEAATTAVQQANREYFSPLFVAMIPWKPGECCAHPMPGDGAYNTWFAAKTPWLLSYYNYRGEQYRRYGYAVLYVFTVENGKITGKWKSESGKRELVAIDRARRPSFPAYPR